MLRRTMLSGSAAALTTALSGQGMAQSPSPESLITRIKMATVGAPDVKKVEELYTKWLGFNVFERGKVSEAMALSWGTPKMTGRDYVSMSSAGSPDVRYRVIQVDAVPGYKGMTTWGWNAIEIICEHPDKVYEKLKDSPFRHVGGPAFISGGKSTIKAVQFAGPAEEILYFTAETGDSSKSMLPAAKSFVDRPFIMVLAGPDAEVLCSFYMDVFKMQGYMPRETTIDIIAKAQGLPPDYSYALGLVRARERGNSIEIDRYPPAAKQRPRADGQLPPGVAMATFSVDDLDAINVKYITPPAKLYGPMRAATIVGPTGELVELFEEKRA